jgi:hypothetical protein
VPFSFFRAAEGTSFDYSDTILLCTESDRGCRIMSGTRWAKPGAIGNGGHSVQAFKTKQVPAGITAITEKHWVIDKGLSTRTVDTGHSLFALPFNRVSVNAKSGAQPMAPHS